MAEDRVFFDVTDEYTVEDNNIFKVSIKRTRYIGSFNLMGFNSPPFGALNTGGVGDVFPRIRKDFKEKSSIPRRSQRGFFIIFWNSKLFYSNGNRQDKVYPHFDFPPDISSEKKNEYIIDYTELMGKLFNSIFNNKKNQSELSSEVFQSYQFITQCCFAEIFASLLNQNTDPAIII